MYGNNYPNEYNNNTGTYSGGYTPYNSPVNPKKDKKGNYLAYQSGSLSAGKQWEHLITGSLDRDTGISINYTSSNGASFTFTPNRYIVSSVSEDKRTVKIITFASNKTIRNQKNQIARTNNRRRKK